MRLTWSEGISTDLSIFGYAVYMDNLGNSEYLKIYDGIGSPNKLNLVYGPLVSGGAYNFKLSVITFNGESELSDPLQVYVCGYPKEFADPFIDSESETEIHIGWKSPKNNGGC